MTKAQAQQRAAWIFGGLSFAFLIGVFFFAPKELAGFQHKILALISALLVFFLGYFGAGSIKLVAEGELPKWGKVSIQAGGGAALFVLVLIWWQSDIAPVKVKDIEDIKEGVRDTRSEVIKLQKQIEKQYAELEAALRPQSPYPSVAAAPENLNSSAPPSSVPTIPAKAIELAKDVPDDANSYEKGLRATAKGDFAGARKHLSKSIEDREHDLAKSYVALARAEFYAEQFSKADGWYEKALSLEKETPELYEERAVVLDYAGKIKEAEPLLKSALSLREKQSDSVQLAVTVNDLARNYYRQGESKWKESESFYQRAIKILEAMDGRSQSYLLAAIQNNLALLYFDQHRFPESKQQYERALSIWPSILKEHQEHPVLLYEYFTTLINAGLLYERMDNRGMISQLMPYATAIAQELKFYDQRSVFNSGFAQAGLASRLQNLAFLLDKVGRKGEALHLQRCAQLLRARFGPRGGQ